MEIHEQIQVLVNALSMNIVDLEEKDNQDYALILNQLEKLATLVKPIRDESLDKILKLLSNAFESLILKDIEPIPDAQNFIDRLYDNFELLQKLMDSNGNKEQISKLVKEQIEIIPIVESAPEDIEPVADQVDNELFGDFINESKEYIDSLEVNIIELEKNPQNQRIINEIFRPFHTLKGVSSFMGLRKLNTISHETENILDMARNNKLIITPPIINVIFKSIDLIKKIINRLSPENRSEGIREDDLQNMIVLLRDCLNQPSKTYISETTSEAKSAITVSETDETAETEPETAKKADDSIRIKTDKLDFLIDMVGELVITFNLVREDKNVLSINDHDFIKKISQLYRVISELQKASMALRMIPIGTTFQKMKRVVRDYNSKNNKDIKLHLLGEETEIDRNIVDSLYDPLVHMLRNSCDHGIENSEERLVKGKDSSGKVTLNAYHKGNSLIIDVIDDGKGLDRKRIYDKAVEKGLIKKDEPLSDAEIYKMIFHAGFSTAESITKVSGRGVGMDVVQQAIKNLGGTIEIFTEQDKGSTFRLILPLTLAIIEGMMVKVQKELYIIPIVNIVRSLKPTADQINTLMGKGESVKISDHLIPIIRLHRKFNHSGQEKALTDSLLIVIQVGEKEFALAVDSLLGIQNVVVKSLGEKFKNLEGVSGATILGDGRVGLILDVNELYYEEK